MILAGMAFQLLSHRLAAQPNNLFHLDTDNGLPSSTVYSVLQDRKGFIWFGTDEGLVRYDGVHFLIVNRQSGLPDNEVLQVQEDSKGRIWIMTFTQGISYIENESLHTFENDSLLARMPHPATATYMFESSKGVLYFNLPDIGIVEMDGDRVKVHNFSLEGQRNGKAIFEDENKEIWYLGLKESSIHDRFVGLSPGNYGKHQFTPLPLDLSSKAGSFFPIKDGFLAPAGDLGLIRYARGKLESIAPLVSKRQVFTWVTQTKGGDILLSSIGDGLLWFKANGEGSVEPEADTLFKGEAVSAVAEDMEGNLWVSTLRSGVYLLKRTEIVSYSRSPEFPLSKVSGCLVDHNGSLWVAGDLNRLIHYPGPGVTSGYQEEFTPTGEIYQISEPMPGWVGIACGFFIVAQPPLPRLNSWIIDIKKAQPSRTQRGVPRLSVYSGAMGLDNIGSVKKSAFDSLRSCFWVASSSHAARFNFNLQTTFVSLKKYLSKRTLSVAVSDAGEVYFATMNGIMRIDFDRDTTVAFHPESPAMNQVYYDLEWHREWGLIMANAQGLFFWKDDRLSMLSSRDGLATDACKDIWIDDYGHLWISSNGGVSKVSRRKGKISVKTFTVADGLASNEVRSVFTHKATIYVSTSKGLSVFREGDLRKIKSIPPPTYVTRIFVEGRDTVMGDTFLLPHTMNNLRFQFAGIAFSSIGQMRYKYRLIGFDPDWVETTLPEAWFNYLTPGEYRLEVVAITKNGIESVNPAVIVFTILTPWYQSWAFRIAMLLTFFSLIWIFFFLRYKARSRREELRRRIMEAEHRALRAQMNPHFIFNSLNSIQKFLARDDRKEAITYFSRFGRLVRLILDATRNQYISLADEVQTLTLYAQLEQLRTDGKFDIEIHTDGARDLESTRIPPMLIQPYLENAIWHGVMNKEGRGVISVTIRQEGNMLICIVEDNGVGRAKSLELRNVSTVRHQSHGTRITEERLALFNENNPDSARVVVTDLYDSDQHPSGTRVLIQIPIVTDS